jgi:hypothetical protein
MTGTDVPKAVRRAALLTFLLAPAGLLLVAAGLLELRWWGSAGADRLLAELARLQAEYGLEPPALLRGREGAVELVVLGAFCLAYSSLGVWLLRGRLWARATALAAGAVATMAGLIAIGSDASESHTVGDYFNDMAGSVIDDRIPAVRAMLYPGWYSWFEDIVQGFQVLASIAALVALIAAVISNADYFSGGRSVDAPPDEWDEALSRVREQSRRDREADT